MNMIVWDPTFCALKLLMLRYLLPKYYAISHFIILGQVYVKFNVLMMLREHHNDCIPHLQHSQDCLVFIQE